MACFWIGLINSLDLKDIKTVFQIKHKPKPKEFMILLKRYNTKTFDVQWNGVSLNDEHLYENMKHISYLEPKNINKGYLCSACDPVLLLISHLFVLNIVHDFNGNIMHYMNDEATRTITIRNNNTHFF